MLSTALLQLNTLQQIQQYVQRYPLPAMPELDRLSDIVDMLGSAPHDAVETIRQTVQQEFQHRLEKELDFAQLVKFAQDELLWVLRDQAIRDIAYLAPGLLEQTKGQHQNLDEALGLLVQGVHPDDQQMEAAWNQLNLYFDEIELEGDISVSHAEREDYFDALLDELEEATADVMETVNEEMYDALQTAESVAQETLREELDNFADEISEEAHLELDPVGYSEGREPPFYGWNDMVQWYEKFIAEERSLPSGPEFKTKSRRRGPRVVDVTHLQEENQHALQRR